MSFVRFVKLRVPAGSARPGPSIGQSLGPLGINMAGELQFITRVVAASYGLFLLYFRNYLIGQLILPFS